MHFISFIIVRWAYFLVFLIKYIDPFTIWLKVKGLVSSHFKYLQSWYSNILQLYTSSYHTFSRRIQDSHYYIQIPHYNWG